MMMPRCVTPIARADSTYSFSRSDKICARVRRAISIQAVMLKAIMTLVMPPPHTEMMRIANRMPGNAVIISTKRETIQSANPPM